MALIKKLFGSKDSEKVIKLPWISLNSLSQLDEIQANSYRKPQLLFKHSTRCGISTIVFKQFEKDYKFTGYEADLYFLDLLKHRDISNEVASRFGVYHESPQLLILKNGKVVKYASHGSINDLKILMS